MRRKKIRRRRISIRSARPRSCSNLFASQTITCSSSCRDCAVFRCAKSSRPIRFMRAEVDLLQSILPPPSKEWEATFRNLRDSAARLFELTPDAPEQARMMILNIESPEQLADFLAPNLNVDVAQKQAMLEELDVEKRVRAVQKHISAQLEIAQIQQKLQKDVASQFSDAQRRAYLRSQIKAIQHELGEARRRQRGTGRSNCAPDWRKPSRRKK